MIVHCFHCFLLGLIASLVFHIFYFVGKHYGKEEGENKSYSYWSSYYESKVKNLQSELSKKENKIKKLQSELSEKGE